MTALPDFRLETHFSKWEFKARYHMTASDAQSISIRELLNMATADEREEYENLWLGYTETFGSPKLRETIAGTFTSLSGDNILCFAGASEGIFAANMVLLDKSSHAIVVTPNYQSHETLPLNLCDVTGIPLDPDDNWSLDIDRIAASIRPNTKLITINFPHNPTGAILSSDRFEALITLCRKHGIYILSDEIFNGLGRSGTKFLPLIADVYEKGLSLNVMSKSYGLPGLRLGWIGCQDKILLSKMERMKHYLSICNSAPSEMLARIALRNGKKLLQRNCEIIDKNLIKLNTFFSKYQNLFDWQVSDASCMAFPRYKGKEGVEEFTRRLVEESGILLLPSSIYASDLCDTPKDRFRIGFGRLAIDEGLAAFDNHIIKIQS